MKARALLFDLDGTIYYKNYLVPGALETLLALKNASIPYRFVTNCTRMTKKEIVIMHPGPMNRGVEIDSSVADGDQTIILDQVLNGVAVRMSILYSLLGPEEEGIDEKK